VLVAGRTTVDVERLHRALRGSGAHDVRVETVLGYRVLGAVLAPVALIFSLASSGVSPALVLMVGGIGGLLGWRMPIVTLEKKAELRHKQIDRELPELIDLLVVTVEAGMGFTQALALASERLSDPLGEELRRALREQQMGRSVEEALEALLERCDTPAMRAFVRSTMRGESLGVSIGAILRNLAVDMRRIRRQDAEEQAQKAPIKMLFPLVFLIFPGVMIVLLGPAGFSISSAFGS
jgi:tight adherence protein C